MRNLNNDTTSLNSSNNAAQNAAVLVNSNAEIKSLEQFSCWLDAELEKLEERFAGFQTPDAYRKVMGR